MTPSPTEVRITHFDTAMALIEVGPLRLLTDPVLDGPGAAFEDGPVHLEKTGAAIDPDRLGRVDAVLLSHDQHGDNLDRAGRAYLARVATVVTTPLAASRLDHPGAVGLKPWARTTIDGEDGFVLTVTATPAQHGPDGTEEATGPVTGFLLSWPGAPAAVYVSGDTVPSASTEEVARRVAPVGVALLHLGHVRLAPFGDARFSLGASQAAEFARQLDAKHVVPLHFEGWKHFAEDRMEAATALSGSAVANRVTWLEPGVPVTFRP